MRRMGPLTREAQAIQNDLVKLARRLDRFQAILATAEGFAELAKAEAARVRGHVPFEQVAADREVLQARRFQND